MPRLTSLPATVCSAGLSGWRWWYPGRFVLRREDAPIGRTEEIRAVFEAFAREDRAAVETVAGWVRAVVFGGSWRFQDAEGLCQDILLELVLLVRRGGVLDPGAFQKLVQTVAKRRAVDAWHRGRRCREDDADELPGRGPIDPLPTAEERIAARQRLDVLRHVIQRLPEHCRELWRMVYVERRRAAEVGEVLGLSAGNVRVRVHRCLEKARMIYAELQRVAGALPADR